GGREDGPRRHARRIHGNRHTTGFRTRPNTLESATMSVPTLFPASVVGSMPRSQFVRDLVTGDEDISPEEYERRLDAAVRYIVAVQEQAGMDVVTDGEWRRRSYIGVIAELAHGFELSEIG